MSRDFIQEIDFFRMEKLRNASSKPSSPERPGPSPRGIQSVVSRINPQLVKTVMAPGWSLWPSGQLSLSSSPPSPAAVGNAHRATPPPLPVFNPGSSFPASPAPDTAPLTIFYNGTVTTYDLPRDKGEAIIRMAEAGVVRSMAKRPRDSLLDGSQLERDLPIARRKSLHSFLEKRKERLASASPYNNHKAAPSPLPGTWR